MRNYDDISNLAYAIAHRIKFHNEDATDMVNDAWVDGSWRKCKSHQLGRTLTNAMIDARRDRSGAVGSRKLTMNSKTTSLSSVSDEQLNALAYVDPLIPEMVELADKLVELLTFSEQWVVRLRIYRDKTFLQIAEKCGMNSKADAQRAYLGAITKMKKSKIARELV